MKRIFFLCFFLLPNVSAHEMLEVKLKVLELMIHDNIPNARSEYAKLTYYSNKTKANALLIEARDRYEIQALKILAFSKYENNEVDEGLSLLCKAGILGDIGAMRDLYLFPKIMAIKNKEVEDACINASLKMEAQTRNIENTGLPLKSVRNKFHAFEYKRKISKMEYRPYFDHLLSRLDIFNLASYQHFVTTSLERNIPKLKKAQREDQERQNDLAASWERQQYLDRRANRENSSDKILAHYKNKNMLLIGEEVKIKLREFNKLRAANKKISTQVLMGLIKESK